MHARFTRRLAQIAVALFVGLSAPPTAVAQAQSTSQTNPQPQPPSQPKPQPQRPPKTGPKPQPKSTGPTQSQPRAPLGAEAFGGAGFTWTAAPDTFEATGLDKTSIEYGGGARVTGIWRDLFAQVNVTRWADTGERVFIDAGGNRYPLGIPLDVETTFVDVSVGWKPTVARARAGQLSPYFGGGVGAAIYSEKSPFAEAGDDVEKNSISYHVLGGLDVSLLRWLGVTVEGRYRYVPDILGEGGVSAELDEDVLGGVQLAVGLRFGVPRTRPSRRIEPPKPTPPAEVRPPAARQPVPPARQTGSGLILEAAPVFLYPDANRVPLRTLEPGMAVRILEQSGDWLRIEFRDPEFGSRVGYVQRKFVQLQKSGTPLR